MMDDNHSNFIFMSDLSLRQYAATVNKTVEGVRKAIATGKIPPEAVGEYFQSTGRPRPTIKDPDMATRCWLESSNPNLVRDRATLSAAAKKAHKAKRGESIDETDSDDEDGDGSEYLKSIVVLPGDAFPKQVNSRDRIAYYEAEDRLLEHQKKRGQLIDAKLAQEAWEKLVATAKQQLQAVPSEAKSAIPSLTVAHIEILEKLIDKALHVLSK